MERRVSYEFTREELELINDGLVLLMDKHKGIVDDDTFWKANELSLEIKFEEGL